MLARLEPARVEPGEYWIRVKLNRSCNSSGLLWYGNNYTSKKFYSTGCWENLGYWKKWHFCLFFIRISSIFAFIFVKKSVLNLNEVKIKNEINLILITCGFMQTNFVCFCRISLTTVNFPLNSLQGLSFYNHKLLI